MPVSRDEILDAIREIIRNDLKFAGMEIGDDLELVGGGLSLDSLDLLMLVTGKLNRDTMGTVGGFADFAFAELSSAGKST